MGYATRRSGSSKYSVWWARKPGHHPNAKKDDEALYSLKQHVNHLFDEINAYYVSAGSKTPKRWNQEAVKWVTLLLDLVLCWEHWICTCRSVSEMDSFRCLLSFSQVSKYWDSSGSLFYLSSSWNKIVCCPSNIFVLIAYLMITQWVIGAKPADTYGIRAQADQTTHQGVHLPLSFLHGRPKRLKQLYHHSLPPFL